MREYATWRECRQSHEKVQMPHSEFATSSISRNFSQVTVFEEVAPEIPLLTKLSLMNTAKCAAVRAFSDVVMIASHSYAIDYLDANHYCRIELKGSDPHL